ncbi:GNAT family N-acetyltransferase [Bacillus mangrovi]|uniref:GNAT family N-acetyltransferase n=1 Tax=Metabacillus mangrovi TaxID=1491830 RepID=A0A7X2V4N0_9BACI|nr:GNAT family N-acetyltransferase [Metabacillus mangrovi]MTH53565.1 GNAT family N-acetyltransferase [Metabacillus mangrovi]
MNVYRAGTENAEAVGILFNEYRIFYRQTPDPEGAERFIRERIEKEESVVFCAETEDGQMAGFVQLYPIFTSVGMKRAWLLNDLFVSEPFRKLGAGQQLLDQAADWCKETEAAYITLETAADNRGAQRLYEKNGYKRNEDFYVYSHSF